MKPGAEARGLLRDSKWQYSNGSKKIQKGRFKGMFLHAVKVSGPSLGVGHRYNNLQSIEVEKSGPSPGEGHKLAPTMMVSSTKLATPVKTTCLNIHSKEMG
ncbi:hypothetical protein PVK06_042368 [Gossypium arboreum]|uniref:Uncharacterized protein n=1 Tax=Gossypium arboreum TaxID=29729 RepID=A0ABR0ML14_GOSAR|nr:hypothetical protein PVK06_042368 [Gossypium arboreum]